MCLRREGHDRRRAGGDAAQRSCRLAGLLPRVRRTSVRDSPQTDGQLSHQAEAASGVAGAPSRCRRGGRQTPGWATCDSAARWPTSSVRPAIRHVLPRGNGTSKRPAPTPSGESERPEGYRALCCCGTISALCRSLPTLLHCRRWGTLILSAASRAERQPSRGPVAEAKQVRFAIFGRALLVAKLAFEGAFGADHSPAFSYSRGARLSKLRARVGPPGESRCWPCVRGRGRARARRRPFAARRRSVDR
jgi:hypothetical protein